MVVFGQHRCAVGTLANHLNAKQVFNELKRGGVPTPHISIVPVSSPETHLNLEPSKTQISEVIENDTSEDEDRAAMAAAIVGSLLGAVGGCLTGLGLLLVPEVGFVLAIGTWGTPLIATVAGAGLGAVSGGLIGSLGEGETSEEITDLDFEHDPMGEYLVMVEGTDDEVHQAETILEQLHQKYLKINLPSISENPLIDFFKNQDFWKSW
jgi:hypothetical protein